MSHHNPPRPEKDAAALDECQQRPPKNTSGETIPNCAPTVKKLLGHRNGAWFFEISEGQRIRYVVEYESESWGFALRFQAESKFERLLAKIGGGAR
jgi:hypothetical protein